MGSCAQFPKTQRGPSDLREKAEMDLCGNGKCFLSRRVPGSAS